MTVIINKEKYDLKDFILEKTNEIGLENPFILIYKYHTLLIGRLKNNGFLVNNPEEISFENLVESRIFSEKGEIHIWEDKGEYKYRVFIDDETTKKNSFERKYYIWGNKISEEEGFIYEENRGMKFYLPENISVNDLPLKYKVRNYYKFSDHGLIEFYDSRLVGFYNKNGEVL